jgi:nucleotide-binding universal stress UspA family protein
MSGFQEVVVHVNDEAISGQAVELAAALAAESGATLTALLAAAPVNVGLSLSAESAALAQQLEREQRASLRAIGERLAVAVQERHGVTIELRLADGDPVEALRAHARVADLLITSQRDPTRVGGLSTGQSARLLVGSACPVLTVPHVGWSATALTRRKSGILCRALVAWADTRESARALHDALPLLERASQVDLIQFVHADQGDLSSIRESLDRVAGYLGKHGVAAVAKVVSQAEPSQGERMLRSGTPDIAVAEALLSHATDIDADLIVMGGYGHTRLWELVLGGVTRTMLETMTIPVLMSH